MNYSYLPSSVTPTQNFIVRSGPRNGRTAIATQIGDQLPKLFQGRLQVVDDFLRQDMRVRQVLGI